MNELVTVPTEATPVPALRQAREIRPVSDPVPILDTARFEHMLRIASAMAQSNMIPSTLCKYKKGDVEEWLDFDTVRSNCFLVVNQAVRWGMDPFSVVSCASMVHGRLTFEGKLIAAVLEAKLGVELDPVWNTATGDDFGITIGGTLPSGKYREVSGTVGDWKTTGKGSPWLTRAGCVRQLLYRGTREWARFWAPGLMLGVYSDDEMMDLQDAARASRALPVPSQQEQVRQIEDSRPKEAPRAPAAPPQQAAPKPPVPPSPPKAPPSPPKPPGAPTAPAPAAEPVDVTDWTADLFAYDDALSGVEHVDTLAEAIEVYGARFADAPDHVREEAAKLEGATRARLERSVA